MFVVETRVPVNAAVIEIVATAIFAERHVSVVFTGKHFHVKSSECGIYFSDLVDYRSALRDFVKQDTPNKMFIRKLLIQKVHMQKRPDFFIRCRRHARWWEYFGKNLCQKKHFGKPQKPYNNRNLGQANNLSREHYSSSE